MAYVLGFFAADGYMTVTKRGSEFWCIQITDKSLLYKIRTVIQSEHKISIRKSKTDNKTLYRLQIGSKEMCENLRSLGFRERKTKSLSVPYIPDKFLPDFVRGYFDGDGNVWVSKKEAKNRQNILTVFTSNSYDFLKNLHQQLGNLGIKGGSLYKSKDNYSRLQFSLWDSLKLYEIMYNNNIKDSDFIYLRRKKQVFDKFVCGRSSTG